MLTPVDCIALRTVRLNDSKNLLSVWSRQAGRLTFAIPAGSSREARRRRAITAPLGTFCGVCDIRPDREILSVRDIMPLPGSPAMNPSPVQTMSAMFLAEALDLLLRRQEADERLSDFLFGSMELLAATTGAAAANFHIIFLYTFAHFAGIAPDTGDYGPKAVFDMREGRFRPSAPLHDDHIEGDEARMMMLISRTPLSRAGRLPLSRAGRNRALDLILRYFTLHLSPLGSLKSPEILRML